MIVEIISRSISTKVWDLVRIKLMIPGSALGLATDCAMGPGPEIIKLFINLNSAEHKIYPAHKC